MNKRLLFPLIVVGVMVLASMACITVNVYDGPAPVRPTSSPAEVAAAQEQGQDFLMMLAMIVLIFWSGFTMLGKSSRMTRGARLYQAIYWLSLLGGLAFFAWGVLTLDGLKVAIGAGLGMASIPWGFWGDRLF